MTLSGSISRHMYDDDFMFSDSMIFVGWCVVIGYLPETQSLELHLMKSSNTATNTAYRSQATTQHPHNTQITQSISSCGSI